MAIMAVFATIRYSASTSEVIVKGPCCGRHSPIRS